MTLALASTKILERKGWKKRGREEGTERGKRERSTLILSQQSYNLLP